MKTKLFAACLLLVMQAHAQFVNNGGTIFIDNEALVVIDHSLNGLSGAEIVNNGKLYVSGDIVNDATPDFFKKQTSTGTLVLNGTEQAIRGKNNISIYNLELQNDNVKNLYTTLFIGNELILNNAVLNAENNDIFIQNDDPSAIIRNSGYIATQQDARLVRNTAQRNANYLFPVGSLNQQYYQPVDIVTTGADKGSYAVTFHEYSAADDGFSLNAKDPSVGVVNDQYYYTIQQLSGTDNAGILFYTDSTRNNTFSGIGVWSAKQNQWELPASATPQAGVFGNSLNRAMLLALPDFANIHYTTVKEDPTRGSKLIQIPNSFTANGDGLNDFWEIKGIEKFPNNHVSIFNRWGELIYETRGYSFTNHFDASNVMQGVYMYIVDVRDNKGYIKTYTGDLTILR